ncbi:hypothetical protein ABEF95_011462 [Exophiala dermatitidis]
MSKADGPATVSTLKAMRRSFSLRSSLAAPFRTGSLRSRRKLRLFSEKYAEPVTPSKDVKVKGEYKEKGIVHVQQNIGGEHTLERGGDPESGNLSNVEDRNGNVVDAMNSLETNEKVKADVQILCENNVLETDSASHDLAADKTAELEVESEEPIALQVGLNNNIETNDNKKAQDNSFENDRLKAQSGSAATSRDLTVDKTVDVDVAVAVAEPNTLQVSSHTCVEQQGTATDDANHKDKTSNVPDTSPNLDSTAKSSTVHGDEETNLISLSQAQTIIIPSSAVPATPPAATHSPATLSSHNISDPDADADPYADPFTEPDTDPFYIPSSTLPPSHLDQPLPLGHDPLFTLSLSRSESPPESNIEETYFATPISRLHLSSNPGFNRSSHLTDHRKCTMSNYAAEIDRRIVANSDMRDFAYDASDKLHRRAYGHADGERDWVEVEGFD